jgi:hypothetical protein
MFSKNGLPVLRLIVLQLSQTAREPAAEPLTLQRITR